MLASSWPRVAAPWPRVGPRPLAAKTRPNAAPGGRDAASRGLWRPRLRPRLTLLGHRTKRIVESRTRSATICFVRFVTKRIKTRGRDISLFVLCQQNETRIIPKCTDRESIVVYVSSAHHVSSAHYVSSAHPPLYATVTAQGPKAV